LQSLRICMGVKKFENYVRLIGSNVKTLVNLRELIFDSKKFSVARSRFNYLEDRSNFNSICALIKKLPQLESMGMGFRGYLSKEKQDVYWETLAYQTNLQSLAFIEDGLKYDKQHAENFVKYLGELKKLEKLKFLCHHETKFEFFQIIAQGISQIANLTDLTLVFPEIVKTEKEFVKNSCQSLKNLTQLQKLSLLWNDGKLTTVLSEIRLCLPSLINLKCLIMPSDTPPVKCDVLHAFLEACSQLPSLEEFECRANAGLNQEDSEKRGLLRCFNGFSRITSMKLRLNFLDEIQTVRAINVMLSKPHLRIFECETRVLDQGVKDYLMFKNNPRCLVTIV